jgi:hypothetical protein
MIRWTIHPYGLKDASRRAVKKLYTNEELALANRTHLKHTVSTANEHSP